MVHCAARHEHLRSSSHPKHGQNIWDAIVRETVEEHGAQIPPIVSRNIAALISDLTLLWPFADLTMVQSSLRDEIV